MRPRVERGLIVDLMQFGLEELQALFGKRGQLLYQVVRGEDHRAIQPDRERKSIGKEATFANDITSRQDMLSILEHLAEQVAQRLSELEMAGKTVTLKLRWHDFTLITRCVTASAPLSDAPSMIQALTPLLDQLLREKKPVRLLGLTLSNLIHGNARNRPGQISKPSLWDAVGE